jgi:hypothetical protein
MSGNPIVSKGTQIYISPVPYAAATVLIDGVTDIPELGLKRKAIDVTALSDKYKKSMKGTLDIGNLNLSGNYHPSDPGQATLARAVIVDSPYNFKVKYSDGSTDEFSAQVLEYGKAPGKVDSVAQFKAALNGFGAVVSTAAA